MTQDLFKEKWAIYEQHISQKGLKSTRQRDVIVEEFFREHEHLTVEELWQRVRKIDSKIGYATVYRTLKLLSESGLAHKRQFGEAQARFEHATDHHHDHLICMSCHQIIEFENDEIETLQERVCKKHKFQLVHHKMELYGYCEKCSAKKGRGI